VKPILEGIIQVIVVKKNAFLTLLILSLFSSCVSFQLGGTLEQRENVNEIGAIIASDISFGRVWRGYNNSPYFETSFIYFPDMSDRNWGIGLDFNIAYPFYIAKNRIGLFPMVGFESRYSNTANFGSSFDDSENKDPWGIGIKFGGGFDIFLTRGLFLRSKALYQPEFTSFLGSPHGFRFSATLGYSFARAFQAFRLGLEQTRQARQARQAEQVRVREAEQARAREDQIARRAQEEARRIAHEEAIRQMDFIIEPSNLLSFNPGDFRNVDLFEAVVASEGLGIGGPYLRLLNLLPSHIYIRFVSDMVFVSQSGTDIIFRTEDNAISRQMKVTSRTGLTAGQIVRVYYNAFRRLDWQVVAIERPQSAADSPTLTANIQTEQNRVDENQNLSSNIEQQFDGFTIGDLGPGGGIVFYDKGNYSGGWRYLEAVIVNQGTSLAWASAENRSTLIAGTETSIGAGKRNTALILARDPTAPAALASNTFNSGGKTDWFLPSRAELNELHRQRSLFGISSGRFWSSSQDINAMGNAWSIDFGNHAHISSIKNGQHTVIAVRAF
jgi:hypothetical protein